MFTHLHMDIKTHIEISKSGNVLIESPTQLLISVTCALRDFTQNRECSEQFLSNVDSYKSSMCNYTQSE